jgi:hypothetical protein
MPWSLCRCPVSGILPVYTSLQPTGLQHREPAEAMPIQLPTLAKRLLDLPEAQGLAQAMPIHLA